MLPYKNTFSNWKTQHEIQGAIGGPINLQNCCHQQWIAEKPGDYLIFFFNLSPMRVRSQTVILTGY